MSNEGRARDRKMLALEFGIAACENGLDLLAEASALRESDDELVTESGSAARAFALTALAAEEVTKGYVCLVARSLGDDDGVWDLFGGEGARPRHPEKFDMYLSLENVLPRLAGVKPDELAHTFAQLTGREIFQRRQGALYVDLSTKGVKRPSDIGQDPETEGLRARLAKSVTAHAIAIQGALESDLESETQRSR